MPKAKLSQIEQRLKTQIAPNQIGKAGDCYTVRDGDTISFTIVEGGEVKAYLVLDTSSPYATKYLEPFLEEWAARVLTQGQGGVALPPKSHQH